MKSGKSKLSDGILGKFMLSAPLTEEVLLLLKYSAADNLGVSIDNFSSKPVAITVI